MAQRQKQGMQIVFHFTDFIASGYRALDPSAGPDRLIEIGICIAVRLGSTCGESTLAGACLACSAFTITQYQ